MEQRPDPLAEPDWMRPARPAAPAADPLQHMLDRATGGGARVKWMPGSVIKDPGGDTRCVAFAGSADLLNRCTNERAWTVWIGCEHEHVDKSDICEQHIEMAMKVQMTCQTCWDRTRQVSLARAIKKERPDAAS